MRPNGLEHHIQRACKGRNSGVHKKERVRSIYRNKQKYQKTIGFLTIYKENPLLCKKVPPHR
jgi:hypothetical protein